MPGTGSERPLSEGKGHLNSAPTGEPSLRVAGLEIWVHGRESPGAQDHWDGNWLRVTARCVTPGASRVHAEGPILHLSEIEAFLRGCEAMHESHAGSAALDCMEPNLSAELSMESAGHLAATVHITPDHLTETHTYRFEIDQSFLPEIIRGCRRIMEDYPVRGSPDGE